MNPTYDVRHGHARVDDRNGEHVADLIDLGGVCAIDVTGDLDVEGARALGHALISWSVWRRGIVPTVDHYQRTGQTPAAVVVSGTESEER